MAVALKLPRAEAITDALLEPVPELSIDEVRAVRAELTAALVPMAAELPPTSRLVLDGHRFRLAMRHPERCALEAEEFHHSAPVVRRAVGLAAVNRCLRTGAASPGVVMDDVLEVGDEQVAAERGAPRSVPWWTTWFAGLGRAGRAVVAAEANTWATALWTSVQLERLARPVVVGSDDWWSPAGARNLSLHGRSDVRAQLGQRSVLITVEPGTPDAQTTEVVFPTLVAVVANEARPLPGRVLGIWPACGQVRMVDIDATALRQCAERVVSAAGTWLDVALGTPADRTALA